MAGQNGGWYAVGRGIRDLLQGLAKPKSASVQAGSRQDPVGGSVAAESAESESPGQYGDDATRDLSTAEIRGLRPSYAPDADGDPDPGEVVWTWVPYEEHDGRGKDRPVLVIARVDGVAVAGCFLSTKQHNGYVSVGTGGWDSQGRESFLAPDRVLRLTAGGMRREGHVLGRARFESVAAQVAQIHGLFA